MCSRGLPNCGRRLWPCPIAQYLLPMRLTEPTVVPARLALLGLALLGSLPLGALAGCNGTIDEGPVTGVVYSGASRFPRLSHDQWENATRDLLHLDDRPGDSTAWDAETTTGLFQNVGAELSVTGDLWEDYREASERLAVRVAGDPAALARILPAGVSSGDARGFIEGFGLRAYRRPLSSAEIDAYLAAFTAAAPNYPSLAPFEAGVAQTIATMLQSPNFLYRVERSVLETGLADRIPLDGYEIAARLSFALWNSMPDDELFRAAQAGELGTEAGIRAQAERMLEDPRTEPTLLRFHHLWLSTSDYITASTARDTTFFEEYTPEIWGSMVGEVDAFVSDVVVERDLGLSELLTARYTFADSRIAPLYGQSVAGDAFQRIELDPAERAGILSLSGFLARNATFLETDPIHRGVFVARRLVCADLPAPPNGVPRLPADTTGRSMRERIDEHTASPACANCHHRIINPLGFPFERFDALGRVQDPELRTGAAIDTTSEYRLDGTLVSFADGVELAARLAESRQVHDCYAQHLAEFVFADRPVRRSVARRGGEVSLAGGSTRDVLLAIVTDELFRSRPTAPYFGPAPTAE